jgi:hypothetical protein
MALTYLGGQGHWLSLLASLGPWPKQEDVISRYAKIGHVES